jgi:Tfp pilus assembly protein PilF
VTAVRLSRAESMRIAHRDGVVAVFAADSITPSAGLKSSHDRRIVYADLGTIYMQQKKSKEAQPAPLRAVELDPALPDAHYQLGRLYQSVGNKAATNEKLREVLELHETDDALAGKMPSSPSTVIPDSDI